MRGEIQHVNRAKQLVNFANMQFKNKITPTDIDGLIEYDDRCFVFFELKYKNGYDSVSMPYGQSLALQRIVDNLNKPSILFLASHAEDDTENQIDAAQCKVERFYYKRKWKPVNDEKTLREAVDGFFEKIEKLPY